MRTLPGRRRIIPRVEEEEVDVARGVSKRPEKERHLAPTQGYRALLVSPLLLLVAAAYVQWGTVGLPQLPFSPPLEEAFLPKASQVIEKARWLHRY